MKLNGIPVEERIETCRFGCVEVAVGEFETPNGCACFPDDRRQKLCVQHVISAEPLGAVTMIRIFDIERFRALTAV